MTSNVRNLDRSPVRPPDDAAVTDPATLSVVVDASAPPTIEELNHCIDALALELSLQCEAIAQLRVTASRHRRDIYNMEQGLTTARRIGAAIGIVMTSRKVTEDQAFTLLSQLSQATNRKLRDIADDVVLTGMVEQPPAS